MSSSFNIGPFTIRWPSGPIPEITFGATPATEPQATASSSSSSTAQKNDTAPVPSGAEAQNAVVEKPVAHEEKASDGEPALKKKAVSSDGESKDQSAAKVSEPVVVPAPAPIANREIPAAAEIVKATVMKSLSVYPSTLQKWEALVESLQGFVPEKDRVRLLSSLHEVFGNLSAISPESAMLFERRLGDLHQEILRSFEDGEMNAKTCAGAMKKALIETEKCTADILKEISVICLDGQQ